MNRFFSIFLPLITLAVFLFPHVLSAQSPPAAIPGTTLAIHQNTLNRFFDTLGPIQGTSNVESTFFNSRVDWTVTHPRVVITKTAANFEADVAIRTPSGFQYNSKAKGRTNLVYNPSSNVITADIQNATFEIALDLLGNHMHITDIDITKYYKTQQLAFPVPQPRNQPVAFRMPNNTTRNVLIKASNQQVWLDDEKLMIGFEWTFTDVTPPVKVTPIVTPIITKTSVTSKPKTAAAKK